HRAAPSGRRAPRSARPSAAPPPECTGGRVGERVRPFTERVIVIYRDRTRTHENKEMVGWTRWVVGDGGRWSMGAVIRDGGAAACGGATSAPRCSRCSVKARATAT